MNLKKILSIASLGAIVAFSSTAAFAGGTPQNHHCKMADGTMDMKETKKQCIAAKGTWAKDAGAPAMPAPAATAAPAASAAPAAAPAPAPAPK